MKWRKGKNVPIEQRGIVIRNFRENGVTSQVWISVEGGPSYRLYAKGARDAAKKLLEAAEELERGKA